MNRKWIYVGCGGCLVVVILVALGTGGVILGMKRYVDTIGSNMEQVKSKWDALEQSYPFTQPAGDVLDATRFADFLDVRDITIQESTTRLAWLSQFTRPVQNSPGVSVFQILKNFVRMPGDLIAIGVEQVSALSEEKMPRSEYKYYTLALAAEVYSWTELEPADSLHTVGQKYMAPLNNLKQFTENTTKDNPNAKIEVGPFDRDRFVERIKKAINPDHPNRELMAAQAGRITDSTDAVLVDAWTLEDF